MKDFVCDDGQPPVWASDDGYYAICIETDRRDPGMTHITSWTVYQGAQGNSIRIPNAALSALGRALTELVVGYSPSAAATSSAATARASDGE